MPAHPVQSSPDSDARGCLQDATPLTFGNEFSEYVAQLHHAEANILAALGPLHELAIGGTTVGTEFNTHAEFGVRVATELAWRTILCRATLFQEIIMKTSQSSLPSLFVPHGAPTFALRPGEAGAALVAIAASLPRPRAIVVVSAHWDTTEPTVGFAERPDTIYDFSGFPEALYDLRYPATGSREASNEVLDALLEEGFKAQPDAQRGLDHGAWMPLRLMFPDADVPVLPLSIQSRQGPKHHYRLGQALAPLMSQGVLILASGNLTHNLSDYHRASMNGGQSPAYVRSFADWMWSRLQEHDLPALLDYRQEAPDAVRAHPRDEHLMPLYVALGAAGEKPATKRLYAGIDDYVLAMDAYAFQPA